MLSVHAARLTGASIAPVGEFAARFVRTIILSRLLTASQLGGTVALVTILTSCEVVADVGLGLFVMVNSRENRAQAAAAARQIGMVRGILLSLFLLIFAPFLAAAFGSDSVTSSIRWLGIIPLMRSLRNWRTLQIQADYRFWPEAVASITSQLAAVIIVLPAAIWFRDERAMLASLFVEVGLYTATSHLAVARERVVAVDPAIRRAALTYGLPLVVNAIGLIAMSQLDRVIVARLFGLGTLALYSLVAGIAFVPISVLLLILGKILMAFILVAQEDAEKSQRAALNTAWIYFVSAASYALLVGALLDVAVPLLYGGQYRVPSALHAMVTLLVFTRICRGGLSTIFLAYNRTRQLTTANLLAGVGPLIGFVLGISVRRVEAVMLGMLVGEMLSLFAMLRFTRARLSLRAALVQLVVLIVPSLLAAAGALAQGSIPTRAALTVTGVLIVGLDARFAVAKGVQRRDPGLATARSRRISD